MEQRTPRILLWDIEASDLKADYGFVFCIGWKWLDCPDTNLISIRDFKKSFKQDVTNDKEVIKAFAKVMAQADLHVTWYGARFDLPFVQARCLIHDLDPMPLVPHVDGWRIAKDKLKLQSNRLDNLSRIIPVSHESGRQLKTPIDGRHWVRGKAGYVDSLKYIETHCVADIKTLEAVYLKLRKYGHASTPNLSRLDGRLEEGCPTCGSSYIHSRGYCLKGRAAHRKYQCQACKHWFSLPASVKIS